MAGPRPNPDDGSKPPQAAIAVLVTLVFGLPFLAWALHFFGIDWRSFLPYGDSENWYIAAIFAPLPLLVIVAVVTKLWEARRASEWAQTTGRIVRSEIEQRHHRFAGEAETVKSVPAVEYEFSVRGRDYRGARIAIGDVAGMNIEATLGRYPAGRTVTVYYDPSDPNSCVLERDMPEGMFSGCLTSLALLAAAVAGIYFASSDATRLLAGRLPPDGNASMTVALTGFAAVVVVFFFVHRRYTKQAIGWPSVPGKVIASRVESFVRREDGQNRTIYVPAVEYAYSIHGNEYRSRQIRLGLSIEGSETWAKKTVARYPEGSEVVVHYDPNDVTAAALENPRGFAWILLVIAAALLALAVFVSGLYR